ncbi:hypothetical protein BFF78_29425 [Streptomyces fodineus]|uniref:SnoaL-like domain-containing protein n=1 Tax=Streptomyces fodineus TaxID=1904616 RepID=A0A1D7YGD4_9ACTN|nr:nuclear transport factor 2 family protein [Streptomyces fodineus]AOR34621.1 hypothetical protein BFF78_29425 [Streptomyces fodineus]
MDLVDALLAQHACEHVILHFVRRLDLGEPADVADLFTEDGIWEWPPPGDGRRIEGREALRAYFGSRPDDGLSCHLMSDVLVTITGPDTASATSSFATYRVDGYEGGAPVPAGPPLQVGRYEDTFRRFDGKWWIASRTLHPPVGGDSGGDTPNVSRSRSAPPR